MRTIFLLITLLLSTTPTVASAQSRADALCEPLQPLPDRETVVIDAIDGSVDGRTRFDDYAFVRVVVKNLNPFLADYDIELRREPIDEPGLARFTSIFAAAPGLLPSDDAASDDAETPAMPTVSDDLAETLALPAAAPGDANAQAGNAGQNQTDPRQAIEKALENLQVASNAVSQALTTAQGRIEALDQAVARYAAPLRSRRATCHVLVEAAEIFGHETTTDALYEAIGGLHNNIKSLEETIRTVAPKINRASGANLAQIVVQPFQRFAEDARKTLAAARAKRAAVEEQWTAIQATLERPENFRWVRDRIGGEPSVVIIRVVTRTVDAASGTAAPFETALKFGSQRFVLAIGAAFADLANPEFSLDQGFVRDVDGALVTDDDGQPTLGRVVSLDDGSDDRITPTLLLHTRLRGSASRAWFSGFYLSLGLTANFTDGGADVEYLVGPSIAFAENRFFLTLGYYNGRVDHLKDGFYEGFEAPMTLTDPPVRSDRDAGWAIALSYKIN